MTWNVISQEEGTLGPLTEPCGDSRGEAKLPCERGLRLRGCQGDLDIPAPGGDWHSRDAPEEEGTRKGG